MSYEENERLSKVEDQLNEALATLMLLEFALEQVTARILSDASVKNSQRWRKDFVQKDFGTAMQKRGLNASLPSAYHQQDADISHRSIQMAEVFVKNVVAQEDAFRKQKGLPPSFLENDDP
jgi:hypothetical protein